MKNEHTTKQNKNDNTNGYLERLNGAMACQLVSHG